MVLKEDFLSCPSLDRGKEIFKELKGRIASDSGFTKEEISCEMSYICLSTLCDLYEAKGYL